VSAAAFDKSGKSAMGYDGLTGGVTDPKDAGDFGGVARAYDGGGFDGLAGDPACAAVVNVGAREDCAGRQRLGERGKEVGRDQTTILFARLTLPEIVAKLCESNCDFR